MSPAPALTRSSGGRVVLAVCAATFVLAFVGVKMRIDRFVVPAALASMAVILSGIRLYLRFNPPAEHSGG